jgi:DNA replication protein DnaC
MDDNQRATYDRQCAQNLGMVGIPKRFQTYAGVVLTGTPDENHKELLTKLSDDMCSFVNSGCVLFLHSSTAGNGKTATAVQLLRSFVKEIANSYWRDNDSDTGVHEALPAKFVSFPELLQSFNVFYKGENVRKHTEFVDDAVETSLLVLDNFMFSVTPTDAQVNFLTYLFDKRWSQKRATIITSNYSPDDVDVSFGNHISRRIFHKDTFVVEYKSPEYTA